MEDSVKPSHYGASMVEFLLAAAHKTMRMHAESFLYC